MWEAVQTFIIMWNDNDHRFEALANVAACFGFPKLKRALHFDTDFYGPFKDRCQIWVEKRSTNRDYFSQINCFLVRLTSNMLLAICWNASLICAMYMLLSWVLI